MLWTLARQAPLFMGFSRREYWSGLPCPPPGDLLNPGIEPTSHVSCIGRWVLYHKASLIQLVKNHRQCRRPQFNSWVGKIHWRMDRLPTPVFLGFPCGSAGKESACTVGELGLIPGLGRSLREGKDYPLQYSGLENSMDNPWGSQRVGHDFCFTS